MSKDDWYLIGIKNGIIDLTDPADVYSFGAVYQLWFKCKMGLIRPQSLDRIEVTFNKYFLNSAFIDLQVHRINEIVVSDFLNFCLVNFSINRKEFARILSILKNVLVYALDFELGGVKVLDFNKINRYVQSQYFVADIKTESTIPISDIKRLFHAVIFDKIYFEKQSACLCLLLNFYLGLRIGELAGLTWSDVDDHVLHVRRTQVKLYGRDSAGQRLSTMHYVFSQDLKTDSALRDIPLTQGALYVLQLLRDHHDRMHYQSNCNLAFDGIPDGILVRSLDRTLRRLCRLTNVTYFNSHLIRKTFATLLHDFGVPDKELALILGHVDISTTEKYYILSNKDYSSKLKKAMDSSFKFL